MGLFQLFLIIMNLSTLVFVVTSMLAMGLSLTVAQIRLRKTALNLFLVRITLELSGSDLLEPGRYTGQSTDYLRKLSPSKAVLCGRDLDACFASALCAAAGAGGSFPDFPDQAHNSD